MGGGGGRGELECPGARPDHDGARLRRHLPRGTPGQDVHRDPRDVDPLPTAAGLDRCRSGLPRPDPGRSRRRRPARQAAHDPRAARGDRHVPHRRRHPPQGSRRSRRRGGRDRGGVRGEVEPSGPRLADRVDVLRHHLPGRVGRPLPTPHRVHGPQVRRAGVGLPRCVGGPARRVSAGGRPRPHPADQDEAVDDPAHRRCGLPRPGPRGHPSSSPESSAAEPSGATYRRHNCQSSTSARTPPAMPAFCNSRPGSLGQSRWFNQRCPTTATGRGTTR